MLESPQNPESSQLQGLTSDNQLVPAFCPPAAVATVSNVPEELRKFDLTPEQWLGAIKFAVGTKILKFQNVGISEEDFLKTAAPELLPGEDSKSKEKNRELTAAVAIQQAKYVGISPEELLQAATPIAERAALLEKTALMFDENNKQRRISLGLDVNVSERVVQAERTNAVECEQFRDRFKGSVAHALNLGNPYISSIRIAPDSEFEKYKFNILAFLRNSTEKNSRNWKHLFYEPILETCKSPEIILTKEFIESRGFVAKFARKNPTSEISTMS